MGRYAASWPLYDAKDWETALALDGHGSEDLFGRFLAGRRCHGMDDPRDRPPSWGLVIYQHRQSKTRTSMAPAVVGITFTQRPASSHSIVHSGGNSSGTTRKLHTMYGNYDRP